MKARETHESSENYLESILMLSKSRKVVRSIDIANMLSFSKPSVSVAMKRLREESLIAVDENGYITLTPDGLQIATGIYEKHIVLTNLLVELGVDAYTAGQDACRIEHVLSPETFKKIKEYYLSHSSNSEKTLQQISGLSDPEHVIDKSK